MKEEQTMHTMKQMIACFGVLIAVSLVAASPQDTSLLAIKAFPTAEGFGAKSQGGRGGRVIEVTNLNDSGDGSLRSGMEASGPRICVFRVSGTITLKNAIRVSSPYLTVAGQTSPGGVQIKGTGQPEGDWGVWFINGAHNIIVRHLRVRMGGNMQHDAGNNILCYGTAEPGVHDVIVDHCSVCWGSDTQLDWYGSYLDRATFQWNIIAEADMGSHIGGNRAPKNITLHHNLYANLGSRTPLMQHADMFDFRNNVIYNWNGNNSAVFGQFALNTSAFGNVVDNLWLAGPESGYPYLNVGNGGPVRIDGSAADDGGTKLYLSGNGGPRCPAGCTNDWTGHGVNTWDYYELNKDGSTHLVDQTQYDAGKPFQAPTIASDPVSTLLDKVLPTIGAYKPFRDVIDLRIVKSVQDKTGTYRVNTSGPWPDLASGAPVPQQDCDHDGMPDAWEKAHGLDPNNNGDGAAVAANGYTNVENYLNELAGDPIPGLAEAGESGVPAGEVVFYVSPLGNDSWLGRVATPRQTDGPFATIARAQQAVRKIRKTHPQAAVRVTLGGGTYYLDSPLEFGPEDSGTEDAPVVYAAAPGEKVVISGGRRLEGGQWGEVNGQKAWVIDIPEVKDGRWNFRQLFVNGQRRPRPRLPREGEYQIEALPDVAISNETWQEPVRRFVYTGTDIQPWHNLADVEVVAPCRWVDNRLPIRQIDPNKRIVTFDRSSRFNLVELYHTKPSTYWVENVIEAMDTPGQWYLDRPLGQLYYLPGTNQDVATVEFVAPRLAQVMRVVGRQDTPVQFLRFEGLVFAHTEWAPPPDWATSSQAAVDVPGAVFLTQARHCTISQSRVEHVGTYAIELGAGCLDIDISHNLLTDLGGGGVKIGHDSQRTTVADNEIIHAGRIFMSAVGIWIGHSAGNKIIHNHIHDLHYSGISVGWQWNFEPSKAVNNIIEYNHIHDLGHGLLSDMGGIYTLGVSPGTRLRYNLIHDVKARAYGGWGIYPDEGSSEILIENNLVYQCSSSPFFAHINRHITVRNNIFAFGEQCQVERAGATSGPEQEYAFLRNIVYYRQGQLVGYWDTQNSNFAYKSNLYWNASGSSITFSGKSWNEWQAAGQDKNSLIADPLFVDPERGDFRLRPDSPAAKIGFEPWDLSDVGPRTFRMASKENLAQ